MAAEVYTLGTVFLNDGGDGTLLDQCVEMGYEAGDQEMVLATDGGVDPTWIGLALQSPALTFATTDLAELLALNTSTFAYAGLELSASQIAELYWQQAKYAGALWTGSKHLKQEVNKGLLFCRGFRAAHGEGAARAFASIAPTWDGTNDPVVPSESAAMPGTPAVTCAYGPGPVTINAIALDSEVLSIVYDSGIGLRAVGGGSVVWPWFVGIRSRRPTFGIRVSDASLLYDLGLIGAAVTSATLYLRGFERAGKAYADASEEHIKITLYQGRASAPTLATDQDRDAFPDLLLRPSKASGNAIMTVQAGVAIT